MEMMSYVADEWRRNSNAVRFKIALGRREATWWDRHDYGLESAEPGDETLFEAVANGLIWTAYLARHPINVSRAYWHSLKELGNPSDMF